MERVYSLRKSVVYLILLVCAFFAPLPAGADVQHGCWFRLPEANSLLLPAGTRSVLIDRYFRIHYSPSDSFFVDADRDGLPDVLSKQIPVLQKSRHFLETELGWRLPVSRTEAGTAELDVYFIQAGRRFTGSVISSPQTVLVLNRKTLVSKDFPAFWIHQLAHAAELVFRDDGDYWFYEATAGWFEGQFLGYSTMTRRAQQNRLARPDVSLLDATPVNALGASQMLEMMARPLRDVVRQAWQQWSYTPAWRADEALSASLALNQMPDLESYLQNYSLLQSPSSDLDLDSLEIQLAPFSSAVIRGMPQQASGGAKIEFAPQDGNPYSTAGLFYASGEKSGTLTMKKGLTGPTSLLIPYAGMDQYRFVVVNAGASWMRGKLTRTYDPAIPGVLEYFRVNSDENGVQIEWKTSRENGVAFWNLYRLNAGRKELLNDFPIPAALNSTEGIRYIYFDSADASYYSLEAITSEGYASPLATAETPQ